VDRLTKADRITAGLGVVALLAGIVVLLAVDGDTAATAGALLLGLAGVAFVALVFLLVGESEDRDRRDGML
jgi:peptidoglycan/LPS O-acetylase OafA/YrhL